MSEKGEREIYDVEVTDENVQDMLHTMLYRLMEKYGPRIKDYLAAIALGPNAFKALEEWGRSRARFSFDGQSFQGIRIVCSALPFAIPLFNERGWYIAHEEAKRITARENDTEIN